MAEQTPRVGLKGIAKYYGETTALADTDLDIAAGEYVVLLGPSGSGKTTLLSILGGFVEPSSGRVWINGHDVTDLPAARRPTATVFQDYALFPHMSVSANVAFGLAMRRMSKPLRMQKSEEMLELVGLKGFGRRGVHQLSGGQRQRVALARAIAVDPAVLLLDEPLGALDLALRRQMQDELVRLQRRLNATFVHVTHDQEEAMSIADRVVVMKDGRIEDMGPPARVYLKPASLFTARFMGENNLFAGQVIGRVNGQTAVDTIVGRVLADQPAQSGEKVHVALRPEQLRFSPELGAQALGDAVIGEFSFQGTHFCVHCRLAGQELIARVPAEQPPRAGEVLPLYARAGDLVLLRQ
ncbi:MAG: ABC transporter ATP-binding protein [Dongiaceae bacterium]